MQNQYGDRHFASQEFVWEQENWRWKVEGSKQTVYVIPPDGSENSTWVIEVPSRTLRHPMDRHGRMAEYLALHFAAQYARGILAPSENLRIERKH